MPTVTALYRYPIKGVRAQSVQSARVEWRGLAGDRRWMLIDSAGDFVSQRGEARLTQVAADLVDDGLVLHAPGADSLPVAFPESDAPALTVDVWGTASPVRHATAADAWLSGWLGYPARLVYQPDAAHRPVKLASGTSRGDHVSLADSYPLLLTNAASLVAVNAQLDSPAEMLRFRPNVVVRWDRGVRRTKHDTRADRRRGISRRQAVRAVQRGHAGPGDGRARKRAVTDNVSSSHKRALPMAWCSV